jgi:long-chain fatty acid transport protein
MKTSGHLKSASQSAVLVLTVLAAGRAHATDGYFDYVQLFIAPTLSYKLTENNAIGLAPIIAYQRFKAYGLENFGIPDQGYDNSYGAGVRIGYMGKLTDWLTAGLTYQSQVFMTRFKECEHLFPT